MMHTNEPKIKTTFLSLPTEIRLMIYDRIPQEPQSGFATGKFLDTITTIRALSPKHLLNLNGVCRLVHQETKAMLYRGTLTISVQSSTPPTSYPTIKEDACSILSQFQQVHFTLHLCDIQGDVDITTVVGSTNKVLAALNQSTELRYFSFDPCIADHIPRLKGRRYELRRVSNRYGIRMGVKAVQREFDYASRMIELLNDEFEAAKARLSPERQGFGNSVGILVDS